MKPNLKRLADAARSAGVKVFIVPHRRYHEGAFDGWEFLSCVGSSYLP